MVTLCSPCSLLHYILFLLRCSLHLTLHVLFVYHLLLYSKYSTSFTTSCWAPIYRYYIMLPLIWLLYCVLHLMLHYITYCNRSMHSEDSLTICITRYTWTHKVLHAKYTIHLCSHSGTQVKAQLAEPPLWTRDLTPQILGLSFLVS